MGEEFWQKEKCKLLLYLSIPKQKESIKAMAMVTMITNPPGPPASDEDGNDGGKEDENPSEKPPQ